MSPRDACEEAFASPMGRAVRANPEDDAARLVFADWAEETYPALAPVADLIRTMIRGQPEDWSPAAREALPLLGHEAPRGNYWGSHTLRFDRLLVELNTPNSTRMELHLVRGLPAYLECRARVLTEEVARFYHRRYPMSGMLPQPAQPAVHFARRLDGRHTTLARWNEAPGFPAFGFTAELLQAGLVPSRIYRRLETLYLPYCALEEYHGCYLSVSEACRDLACATVRYLDSRYGDRWKEEDP